MTLTGKRITEYTAVPLHGNNIDLHKRRFGRFVALDYVGKSRWACLCDCGGMVSVRGKDLLSGSSQSCGCLGRELASARLKTHGMTRTPEWIAWIAMHDRCTRKAHPAYHHYGGRGITVCERWKTFENFLEDMGLRPEGRYTLDRTDNDKGYDPDNCRWATYTEQENNRRGNRMATINGVTKSVSSFAHEYGEKPVRVFHRLYMGWTIEEALTPSTRKKPSRGKKSQNMEACGAELDAT